MSEFASRFPLSLEFRDVDSQSDWRQTYGQEVPVIFLADKKLFRFRIDSEIFIAAIQSYLDGASNDDKT